jgi:hypothetical protein
MYKDGDREFRFFIKLLIAAVATVFLSGLLMGWAIWS